MTNGVCHTERVGTFVDLEPSEVSDIFHATSDFKLGKIRCQIRTLHARTLCEDENASLDNLRQAVELLEDIDSISSRVFGARHPDTAANGSMLRYAREKLAQAEAPVARRTRSSKAEES